MPLAAAAKVTAADPANGSTSFLFPAERSEVSREPTVACCPDTEWDAELESLRPPRRHGSCRFMCCGLGGTALTAYRPSLKETGPGRSTNALSGTSADDAALRVERDCQQPQSSGDDHHEEGPESE
jgi:hypothetical protein